MLIKGIKDECLNDFKQIGTLIIFPNCSFKCDHDCGRPVCQNNHLAKESVMEIPIAKIIKRHLNSDFADALICGGLEPLDSINDLYALIKEFRQVSNDPVVIYTGYTEDEANNMLGWDDIKWLGNLYVKYGRFIPDQQPHFDEVLGVNLASNNQYGKYYE